MTLRKTITIALGFLLLNLSLVSAADYDRKQRKQYSLVQSKHQKMMDRQWDGFKNGSLKSQTVAFERLIRTTPVLKRPKTIPQFILFCMLTSCAIQGIAGDVVKVPSTGSHSRSPLTISTAQHCVNGHCTNLVSSELGALQPTLATATPLAPAQLSGQTVSALAAIFCESNKNCITASGNTITFTGHPEECHDFTKMLNDYEGLRRTVVPVSPAIGKTQVHTAGHFDDWLEAQKALGIDPEGVKNVAYTEFDCGSHDTESSNAQIAQIKEAVCKETEQTKSIALKYEPASDGTKSFNQLTADAFIERLKTESPFFAYATSQSNNIIYFKNGYIVIDYHKLEPYLASLELPINTQDGGECKVTLELQTVLQRIMAASGGPISLVATTNPKEFSVRMTTIGDLLSREQKKSNPPTLEIIIDKSGSMDGSPIDTINTKIPVLLRSIQERLSEKDLFNVKIYHLNNQFLLASQQIITADSDQPTWDVIKAEGGTNLKPIGRQMKISDSENSNKVLIAFTDGEHIDFYDPLDRLYYKELEELQSSGKFSQLYLCRFGDAKTQTDHFFEKISEIFKGSSSVESDAQKCIDQLTQAIPSMLVARQPVILTINEKNEVHWVQVGNAGITTLTQPVKNNDVITYGSLKAVVQLPETKEEKIARHRAALEELETVE